jgi:hypothetical protein
LGDRHIVPQSLDLPVGDPFRTAIVVLGRARQHLDNHGRLAHLIPGEVDRATDDDRIGIRRRGRGRDLRPLAERPAGLALQAAAQGRDDVVLDDDVRVRAADHHADHAADELVALQLPTLPGEEVVDRPRLR